MIEIDIELPEPRTERCEHGRPIGGRPCRYCPCKASPHARPDHSIEEWRYSQTREYDVAMIMTIERCIHCDVIFRGHPLCVAPPTRTRPPYSPPYSPTPASHKSPGETGRNGRRNETMNGRFIPEFISISSRQREGTLT